MHNVLQGESGFAAPNRPENKRGRSPVEPSAKQSVQLGNSARYGVALEFQMVLCGHETGKYSQPSCYDDVIMKTLAETNAPHFEDTQASSGGPIVGRQLLHFDDAVGQA